jgi:hypothetical protein
MFGIINRGELDAVTEHEIENLNSRLKGLWLKEHNDDGTHKELSLDAIPELDASVIPELDASIVTSGVFGRARLPSAIAYEDEANTFSVVGNVFSEVLSVSKGLLFAATQVASADPNGLDDYEEGTYTPAYSGSLGNGTITGTYVKIGRLVFFTVSFGMGSTTTVPAGGMTFGAPFTAAAAGVVGGNLLCVDSSAATIYTGLVSFNTTTTVLPYRQDAPTPGGFTSVDPFTWATSDGVALCGIYLAAA